MTDTATTSTVEAKPETFTLAELARNPADKLRPTLRNSTPVRLWLEFQSYLPGARNLQRIGAAMAGGGYWGMYVPPEQTLATARAYISGDKLQHAQDAAERLLLSPAGSRGLDLSGHVLLRQVRAVQGKPVNPADAVDTIGYITECVNDVVGTVGEYGDRIDIAYINHEAGLSPDLIASILASVLPSRLPTVVSGLTRGAWEMASRWGKMAAINVATDGALDGRPLLAYVEGWLAGEETRWPRYQNTKQGPLWNSLVDIVNQVLSVRQAAGVPVPGIRGATSVDFKGPSGWISIASKPRELKAYGMLAAALHVLGVEDAIVFNAWGRGEHLKDPACDFAAMMAEDVQTHSVFLQATQWSPLDENSLPDEPFPLDVEELHLGALILKASDLSPERLNRPVGG